MTNEQLSLFLLEELTNAVSFQEFINKVSEILKNPIMVVDARYKIVCASNQLNVPFSAWNRALQEGYITDEMILFMEKENLIEQLKNSDYPLLTELPNGHKGYRMPLFRDGKYCGFVGIYDYFNQLIDAEQLKIVSKAINVLLKNDNSLVNYDDNAYESFLHQLVQCHSLDRSLLVCKKNKQLDFGKNKLLICIKKDFGDNQNDGSLIVKVNELLRQRIIGCYSTIVQNQIVILFDITALHDELFEQMISIIQTVCEQYSLIASISYEYDDTANTYLAFEQCQCTFANNKTSNRIQYFRDCFIECIAGLCTKKYDKSFFQNPIFSKLIAYDKSYQTNYFSTLRTYLYHSGNLKDTAEYLNIHYNTMKYRINMIEEIVDCRIRDDYKLRLELLLSLCIFD